MITEAQTTTDTVAGGVAVLTTVLEFAGLRREWDELAAASDAGVFSSWGWLWPWYARLARTRKPYIVTERDSTGRLRGLLPLCIEEKEIAGLGMGGSLRVRRLAFLGESVVGSDYLDVVARREEREAITRRLLEAVRDSGDWDLLDLYDLDSESPTPELVREIFGEGEFSLQESDGPVCPYERFKSGETFEGFIKKLGRGENYKRRRRWLEKQEGFRIECATRPEQLARPLASFFHLHEMRWSEDGGSDGITNSETEAFHRDAAHYMAEMGKLRLYTMYVGGRAVASFYGLVHRDRMICYQSGRDPDWQSRSVGLVMIGETFKDAFELGLREYDFLRGAEPYKADWSKGERKLVSLRIIPRGSKGVWLHRTEEMVQHARAAARAALPERVARYLRRLRG